MNVRRGAGRAPKWKNCPEKTLAADRQTIFSSCSAGWALKI